MNGNDRFRAQLARRLEKRLFRMDDDLCDAVVIAQVDEQQATEVAHGVGESHQPDFLPDGVGVEFSAGVAPQGCHDVVVLVSGQSLGHVLCIACLYPPSLSTTARVSDKKSASTGEPSQ